MEQRLISKAFKYRGDDKNNCRIFYANPWW